jgi:hypothetical protein
MKTLRLRSKVKLRMALEHRLNPLHVYCRLVPVIGGTKAMVVAHRYEHIYRKVL